VLDPIVDVFAILVVTLILNLLKFTSPGFLGVSFNTVLSELLDIHRFHAR
jgi:hypothetical protein